METTNTSRVLFVEERKGGCSETRETTHTERTESESLRDRIEAARARFEAARTELKALLDNCKHKVSYDVAGHPYDVRRCNACNKTQGLI